MVVVGAILTSMILNQVVLSYQAVEVVMFSVAFSTIVSVSSTTLSELTPRSSEPWHGDLSRRYFFLVGGEGGVLVEYASPLLLGLDYSSSPVPSPQSAFALARRTLLVIGSRCAPLEDNLSRIFRGITNDS